MTSKKANFYVDGFNLYYGICSTGRKDLLWLDLVSLCLSLARNDEKINRIQYFTTLPDMPRAKRSRHRVYLDLLRNLSLNVEIIYGKFTRMRKRCAVCAEFNKYYVEKRTDVSIATRMVADAFTSNCDTLYLISGDSDLVPSVKHIQSKTNKFVVSLFPPNRVSNDMKKHAGAYHGLTVNKLCQFVADNPHIKRNGKPLRKPESWKRVEPASDRTRARRLLRPIVIAFLRLYRKMTGFE
ncbi:MAG: 6-hydroxy-3-succinoylpyridine 3-monooxygenase HspA [Calditrichaeota bacterium]|nr:6-hydroxy-3-succinoylpyridine 3-monooxygenase HspA [Calditrichota bacterium]